MCQKGFFLPFPLKIKWILKQGSFYLEKKENTAGVLVRDRY